MSQCYSYVFDGQYIASKTIIQNYFSPIYFPFYKWKYIYNQIFDQIIILLTVVKKVTRIVTQNVTELSHKYKHSSHRLILLLYEILENIFIFFGWFVEGMSSTWYLNSFYIYISIYIYIYIYIYIIRWCRVEYIFMYIYIHTEI